MLHCGPYDAPAYITSPTSFNNFQDDIPYNFQLILIFCAFISTNIFSCLCLSFWEFTFSFLSPSFYLPRAAQNTTYTEEYTCQKTVLKSNKVESKHLKNSIWNNEHYLRSWEKSRGSTLKLLLLSSPAWFQFPWIITIIFF